MELMGSWWEWSRSLYEGGMQTWGTQTTRSLTCYATAGIPIFFWRSWISIQNDRVYHFGKRINQVAELDGFEAEDKDCWIRGAKEVEMETWNRIQELSYRQRPCDTRMSV